MGGHVATAAAERLGADPHCRHAAMAKDDWRAAIEANTDSLLESGLWGVPSMRIGDFVTWGQDRDWLLVRHLEELCDKGDGILV